MKCKDVSPLLIEYQENSLRPEERGVVEKHLRQCDVCRKEFKEIERLYQLLAKERVPSPEESFWTNFLPEVRARIEEKKKTRGLFFPRPRLVVGVLTVLTVAIVTVFMFTSDQRSLVELRSEQMEEVTLSAPELSSTTEELAEILSAGGEVSLSILLANGEERQLDLIEGILEEDYLSQLSLNSVLSELDTEELKKLEESIKALHIGEIL
ncbi:MAG: zf-HC2 domain-containing protein [Candidatus Zixiibacteriota bacterium]|nr:MAG: zf-HC2 domain-containing protein [candidate division Zixibacteria bacterium]